jgi:diacylglycerol kinase (ATP)
VNISLFVNSTAGAGPEQARLRRELEAGGHQVVRIIEGQSEIFRLADPPAELVVAAGGDGTVAQVLRNMAGRRVPVAILPMGTANNIARSLGIDGPNAKLIEKWKNARSRPLDFGVATGPWGTRFFVEGVGAGLMPLATAATDGHPSISELPPDPKMQRALRKYLETLKELKPARVSLTLDGVDLSDEYLLVEVLNMPSVGPNLTFCPHADPFDGALSVVTAREEHRGLLEEYLDTRWRGDPARISLPVVHAWDVELRAATEMHLDDTLVRTEGGWGIQLGLEPAAVEVLVGA